MRNTSDQENILYELIKSSSLDTLLNGGIYKGERPNNSKKEDTVISAMLTTDGTLQEGVTNVNIYIPKIDVKIDGVNNILKDTKRIGEVLSVAQIVLKGKIGKYYSLWTSKQAEYDEPEINQTRLNFRIEFRLDDTIIL